MYQVTYCLHGYQFTQIFTEDEARCALKKYGWPNVDKLTRGEIGEALNYMFNPY